MLTSRRAALAGLGAILADRAMARPRSIRWPGDARGAVSLTYDDGYDSHLDHARPALARHGLRASFFVTVDNIEARLTDWQSLARQGHEIGNHTKSHPCALSGYDQTSFAAREIVPAEQFLDRHFGAYPRCFAYPCGFPVLGHGSANQGRTRYLDAIEPYFLAARTVNGLPNDPAEVLRRRYLLNGYEPTYDADRADTAKTYLEQTMARGHWGVLVFHEVLPRRRGEGDTSIAVHDEILDWISRQRLWCAPMREVFNHIAGPNAAETAQKV
jgi:peptidoglycan/xylan/chitin deacetylase (PgdA/CDA1 family)